jgi:tricorn protease
VNASEGDYLLQIDGQNVDAKVNPHSLLQGKAGRSVVLTLNDKPSMDGSRKVRVRTIASESDLRYWDFVEGNRKWVEKASGGRVGYIHVPDTASQGAVEFIRGFYSTLDKDAVLIDERWNGGGYIQPWFVDTLARRIKAGIQARNYKVDGADAPAQEGPMAMLINGYAGSGGDFFPWMFRQAKRGPLIGTRTWGGLVGISGGAPLVDGGSVTAPSFSIYDRETNEIIAENRGVDPDIEVDLRPDLFAKGRDPQLERGVEYLMAQLAKLPAPKPRTTIPRLGREGRVDNK